jgi:hypothetical protein
MTQPSSARVHSTVERTMHAVAAAVVRKLANGKVS